MNFELIKKHINPTSVLDIGAHTGMWHNEARLHWLNAYFFLIEGNPACAEQLAMTGASMRIALLSDTEKDVEFFTRKDAPTCTGSSYYREDTEFYADGKVEPHVMRTQRLDDVVEGHSFQFIKIDVQGAELDVFRGGLNTLASAQAVVMELSVVEYNKGAPLMDEVIKFMDDHGFRLAEWLGDIVHPINRNVIQRDALFLRK